MKIIEMVRKHLINAMCICVCSVCSLPAHAAVIAGQGTWESSLLGRDLDGNTATIEAYYDTILNVTWLQDANYAQTSGFLIKGLLNRGQANSWVSGLNPYGSGITGWRLPDTNPVNDIAYDYDVENDGSTDRGYNISAPGSANANSTGSEMAYMFYNTLGNLATFDFFGNIQAGSGLSNSGPFSNLMIDDFYWSGTVYQPLAPRQWHFRFSTGNQNGAGAAGYAWAVHDGDVGAAVSNVPVPAAGWLFGSSILGLISISKRNKAS